MSVATSSVRRIVFSMAVVSFICLLLLSLQVATTASHWRWSDAHSKPLQGVGKFGGHKVLTWPRQ
jgi:hypothetical protein